MKTGDHMAGLGIRRPAALATLIVAGVLSSCDLSSRDPRAMNAIEGRAPETPACSSLADGVALAVTGSVSTQPYTLPGEQPAGPGSAASRTAFVMTLDQPACWINGESTEGLVISDRLQLLPADAEVGAALAAAVGRRVVAHGGAVEAHSPHHRTPVVLLVERFADAHDEAPTTSRARQ
jgi:hypothetical protein